MLKDVEVDALKCLILWPDDTPGYHLEYSIAIAILQMCKAIGYGRVPQLATQIEELWRDPSKAEKYEKIG